MMKSCVHCGYCCKTGPCGYSKWVDGKCVHLEERDGLFYCGIYYDIRIAEYERGEKYPMFGTECCSPLGNVDRWTILKGSRYVDNEQDN